MHFTAGQTKKETKGIGAVSPVYENVFRPESCQLDMKSDSEIYPRTAGKQETNTPSRSD